jgi:acyl carrier protein
MLESLECGAVRDRDELAAALIRVLRVSQSLPAEQPIGLDTRLLKAGLGLDSVAVLEFVLALEAEFECRIEDDEMEPRWFTTVGSVMELMQKKLSAGVV